MKKTSLWTLLAAVVAMLITVSCSSAVPATADSSSRGGAHCRTATYPVTVPTAGTGDLVGDYCTARHGNGRVLLLVAGGGENADYWDMPGLGTYSLARAAQRQGYATLALDRLGTGRSTTPPTGSTVTFQAQVETVHQVVAALHRQGWKHVIGIGHSLGSGTLAGLAAKYPDDLTAQALTGYGPQVTPITAQRNARYQTIAAVADSARWGDLDADYVTVLPADVPYYGLLYLPRVTAKALQATELHQGTHTGTETTTRPQGEDAVKQGAALTKPTLLMDGQHDEHYCNTADLDEPPVTPPQCQSQAGFYKFGRAMLPNAPLTTFLIPGTGHATEMHTTAPWTNRLVLSWVAVADPQQT